MSAAGVVDLVLRTWSLIDKHGGEGVSQLFATNGVIRFGDAVNQGRDEIDLVYRQRRERGTRTSRHVATNLLVDETVDGWHAEHVVTLYAGDAKPVIRTTVPVSVFDVVDEVILDDDGALLIRSRVLTQLFADPAGRLAVSFDKSAVENAQMEAPDDQG